MSIVNSMETASSSVVLPKRQILWRGIKGRCPNCGQGRLFKSYLQQEKHCSHCGEDIGNIRADDGPAWLTILLTGHIIAPLIGCLVAYDMSPVWLVTTILVFIGLLSAFFLLPRTKGLFIAAIWLIRNKERGAV